MLAAVQEVRSWPSSAEQDMMSHQLAADTQVDELALAELELSVAMADGTQDVIGPLAVVVAVECKFVASEAVIGWCIDALGHVIDRCTVAAWGAFDYHIVAPVDTTWRFVAEGLVDTNDEV